MSNQIPRDRPEPEIEITPEMVKAGAEEISAWYWTDLAYDAWARLIFEAMAQVAPSRGRHRSARVGKEVRPQLPPLPTTAKGH